MNGNGGGGGGKPEQGSGGNNMTPQQKAMAANLAARRALIPGPNTQTVKMVQRIASVTNTTYTAGQALTLNFTPAPVGIIRRFYIEVTAIAGIGAAETQTRQPLGPSALVSNITYTDTSNQARVNTTGWHLHWLASIKRRTIFGAAYTSDTPTGFGSNINAISAPATMAAAPSSTNIYMVYEVPLAYAEDDLRGAVFANLINATQNLQVTINPNFFVATAADGTLAGYKSSSTQLGRLSSITVNVYQEYIDQFAGLPLPNIDLGTQYLINWTNGGLPTVNVDLVFPYANFRSYLSTIVFYDNNALFSGGSFRESFRPDNPLRFFVCHLGGQQINFTCIFDNQPNDYKNNNQRDQRA